MERATSQKQLIAEHLKSVYTHPTPREIHSAVKKRLPRLSLGTVYRNLKTMSERGEILEIPGEVSRYDAVTSPHSHFICEKCGEVSDVSENFGLKLSRVKNGKIKSCRIYFYGLCRECLRRTNKK